MNNTVCEQTVNHSLHGDETFTRKTLRAFCWAVFKPIKGWLFDIHNTIKTREYGWTRNPLLNWPSGKSSSFRKLEMKERTSRNIHLRRLCFPITSFDSFGVVSKLWKYFHCRYGWWDIKFEFSLEHGTLLNYFWILIYWNLEIFGFFFYIRLGFYCYWIILL